VSTRQIVIIALALLVAGIVVITVASQTLTT
jgi:hypothetical protein